MLTASEHKASTNPDRRSILKAPAGDGRRRQRRFVTIEAAKGGGGIFVDVLDVLMMCGSDFPYLPVKAYGRNSTKAEI
jgi:hypothetical protein